MDFINLSKEKGLSYLLMGNSKDLEPIIFLHGIMGNKKNLTTFVKDFLNNYPSNSAIIFDLRNHGLSSKHWQPFTVEACGQDISEACRKLELKPQKIIGHSFGGKVALMAAKLIPSITQVWLLDCPPGIVSRKNPLETKNSPSALDIIDILSTISWPVKSRKDLVEIMLEKGVNNAIAAWMTTNLRSVTDGFRLVFEPNEVRDMLLDFAQLDCWPLIKSLSERLVIHLVAAEYGGRVSKEDAEALISLTGKNKGFFHLLKDSGHFVHVDNKNGLIELMKPYL